ncbi:hypothetical protein [Parafilimonas sp.]|uniref:hypothetical protein n=1 Tax=Parafilimonas sp. TaxID=1969739 RepID=UPI003F7D5F6B
MTLPQTAKQNMYYAVAAFFQTNAAAFAGFTRVQTEITVFNQQNTQLENYINAQAGTSKGITTQKRTLLENMADLTVKTSRKALVYAVDNNNDELQHLFDVQVYELEKSTTAKTLAAVQNIYAALQSLNGALADYRVTAADITAIGDAIAAYKAVTGAPENAQAASEAGTKGIEATMLLIDKSLKLLDNLIINGMDDNPGLVNEYREVRKVKEMGTRHTGLMATINDAAGGTAIEGAVMLVQELNKQAASNILGVAAIESMKAGTWHVIISAAGYVTQTQVLKIEQGKTLEMEVRMIKEG